MRVWQKLKQFFTLKESVSLIAGVMVGYVAKQVPPGYGGWTVLVAVVFATICLFLIASKLLDIKSSVEAALSETKQRITDVDRKVSIEVHYMDRETSESEVAMYREFKRLIMEAHTSILVVNSFLVEDSESFDPNAQKARDEYYKALLDKADHDVEYRRILQVKSDESTLKELHHNEDHIKHFEEIIKRIDTHPKIALKRAPAKRLSTFLLIDGEHLIWQINEVVMKKERQYMRLHGAFVITDPQRKITTHFLEYYSRLDQRSSCLNMEDLKIAG